MRRLPVGYIDRSPVSNNGRSSTSTVTTVVTDVGGTDGLQPGETVTARVEFSPQFAGPKEALLRVQQSEVREHVAFRVATAELAMDRQRLLVV